MSRKQQPVEVPRSCSTAVKEELASFFHRNGYVRWLNPERLGTEGYKHYRKGDEVRLVAKSQAELSRMRHLLGAAGFQAGRPYAKGAQISLPLYGRARVRRFLALVKPRKVDRPRLTASALEPSAVETAARKPAKLVRAGKKRA